MALQRLADGAHVLEIFQETAIVVAVLPAVVLVRHEVVGDVLLDGAPDRAAGLLLLKWLLAEGFDTEDADGFATTPLMMAAECGATECVKLLLEAGARAAVVWSA